MAFEKGGVRISLLRGALLLFEFEEVSDTKSVLFKGSVGESGGIPATLMVWEENVKAVASASELVVRCNPVVFTMDVAGVPRRSGIGLEVRGDDDASCIKQVSKEKGVENHVGLEKPSPGKLDIRREGDGMGLVGGGVDCLGRFCLN
ncbi:hypothetical protein CK203_057442 [Vitis vinifera]|uniref:Uncharacterized protein n=1 Tax=Vitis vinifera TaxID=29760 RepID=A0A438GLA5_VITVI|nr:hypothetical protein CK203_057442 [Vitis vinifera]